MAEEVRLRYEQIKERHEKERHELGTGEELFRLLAGSILALFGIFIMLLIGGIIFIVMPVAIFKILFWLIEVIL